MTVPFIESPQFPANISYGSSGGPGFKTFIFEGYSGIEMPSMTWSRAKATYQVEHGIRDKADMAALRAFFYMVRGRAIRFRFKDWGDFELTDQLIGVGDGVKTVFKIVKTYGSTNTYTRRIFKPVDGTFTVKVDGVVVPLTGLGATINYTTGEVTFAAGVIPAVGKNVTVTGEFDVPCRFDTDQFNATHDDFLTESWTGIPVVEVLLEDV